MGVGTGVMFLVMGLAYPLIGILVLTEVIRTLVVSLTRPRRYKPHPACEQCGYSVTGLTGLQCPECGGDLRTVGIITPRMEARRRGGTFSAIAAWTVLAGLIGLILGNMVFMTVGIRAARASTAVAATGSAGGGGPGITSITETLTPASGAYGPVSSTVMYTATGTTAGGSASGTLSVRDSGGRMPMFTASASGAGARFFWTDGSGQMRGSGKQATGADVLAWLKGAGADTTAAGVAEEADELAAVVSGAAALTSAPAGSAYTGTRFTASQASTSFTPVPQFGTMFDDVAMYEVAIVAATVVVWGLGLWFIIARRRKMYREAMAAPVG